MSGVAIPLASPVHKREYYLESLSALAPELEKRGFSVCEVVDSLSAAREAATKYKHDIVLLVFLTGGTSRLARAIVSEHSLHGVLGLCQGLHNSLPSAISAASRSKLLGKEIVLYYCDDFTKPDTCELDRLGRVARAVNSLYRSRVVVVSEGEVSEAKSFAKAFSAEAVTADYETLGRYMEKAPPSYSREAIERLESALALKGIDREKLERALKIYSGLRVLVEEGNFDALAIDCFPYLVKTGVTPCLALALLNSEGIVAACEADLTSTALLMLARALTGRSGWMANPSALGDRQLVLAHCTIALDLVEEGQVVSHFESGLPYSVAATLSKGPYTLASIDYAFRKLAIATVRLEESGMLSPKRCRTQTVLKMNTSAKVLLDAAPANHHVLMKGDVHRELVEVARIFGINTYMY